MNGQQHEKGPKSNRAFRTFFLFNCLFSQCLKSFTILSYRTSFTLTNLQTNAQQNTDD